MAAVVTTAVVSGKRVSIPARVATVTPSMSEATIQAALDAAAAGSTIVFDDGTYNHAYTINKSLLLLAKNPGRVWITGARSGAETWTNQSTAQSTSDLWSCPLTYSPAQVLLANPTTGERYHLIKYDSLAELKTRTMPVQTDHAYGPSGRTAGIGPIESFTWASNVLWVRFKPGYAPNDGTMQVMILRNGVSDGITVAADDVTISGLRLSLFDDACVQVNDDKQRCVVLDCYGEGAQHFYKALSGGTVASRGLKVRFCEWNGGKVYTWRVESHTKEMWDALYSSNLSNRFVRINSPEFDVTNNYIYEVFDAIECKGFDATPVPYTCEVAYNVIDGSVDNVFEFDGLASSGNKDAWIFAHHNFAKDCYTPCSTAPNGGSRAIMAYNIFWQSLDAINLNDTLDGSSKQKFTMLKSVGHGGIDLRTTTQKGIQAIHNTVRIDGGAEARMYTGGDDTINAAAEQSAYDICEYTLNIYDGGSGFKSAAWLLQAAPVPTGGSGTPSPPVGTARPGTGYQLKQNVIRGGDVTASHYQNGGVDPYDTRPLVGDVSQTDPAFGSTPTTYFHPTNATILARGDGAVVGGVWRFSGTPGPSWATAATMLQRRAWRSTVSKSYVNLA